MKYYNTNFMSHNKDILLLSDVWQNVQIAKN